MNNMQELYVASFASVGRPLTASDAVSEAEISASETRLGVRVPDALRAYYLVAGRATDFSNHYDQFLAPDEWTVDGGKVTFLAEDQAVVLYGVEVVDSEMPLHDPPVFMCNNVLPPEWYEVCASTTQFIQVMLLWEGAFGGAMPHTGSALAPPDLKSALAANWRSVGEVNEMHGYSQPGRALCHVQWSDGWRAFVGSTSESDLLAIGTELGLEFGEELP